MGGATALACRVLYDEIVRFGLSAFLTLAIAGATQAAPFRDATADWLGASPTAGWSNKVELCDLDGDGDLDALVANGAAYNVADLPERPYFWRNDGDHFEDKSAELPIEEGWWRVVKCADVDGDGDSDAFFGGTFQSQSVLIKNDGGGTLKRSDTLPEESRSLGDAEFADVDGDADLDLVVADWGFGDPFVVRGRPRLWMNDGNGAFVDDTDARLPGARTGFSWDLEAVDVDDDLDLDLVVSCKVCADGGLLLQNDGDGVFLDQSAFLPGAGNNYEFEAADFDGDGDLDLFTINDGVDLGERVLVNDGGVFVEGDAFASGVNSNDDDNAALVVDADGDGDEDVLIASLSGDDRVLINDGGGFVESIVATDSNDTPGSLGIALGDLDGDGKLDLVMVQGEQAFDEAVYLGDDISADDAAPFVGVPRVDVIHNRVVVRAHDHLSPVRAGDVVVSAAVEGVALRRVPMTWVGEQQWQVPLRAGDRSVMVCAKDRSGHEACSDSVVVAVDAGVGSSDVTLSGGGCFGASSAASLVPLLFVLRRRRRAPAQRAASLRSVR